jgi:UrcA family protein
MKPLIFLAAVVAGSTAVLASTSVNAQPVIVTAETPLTEHVSYADLDLSSDAGVQALEARVRSAAHELCEEPGTQPLKIHLASKACFNAAYADGLDQLQRAVDSQRTASALAGTRVIARGK